MKAIVLNQPYVKQYDGEMNVINPIERVYIPKGGVGPNRKQRRTKPKRFRGNNKGISLVVIGPDDKGKFSKYFRKISISEKIKTIKVKDKEIEVPQNTENNHINRKIYFTYYEKRYKN